MPSLIAINLFSWRPETPCVCKRVLLSISLPALPLSLFPGPLLAHTIPNNKHTNSQIHVLCLTLCLSFPETLRLCILAVCRSCIIRHLESTKSCPICEEPVHKTKAHLSLHSDKTLQEIVYKLVPGLYRSEMLQRRGFLADNPELSLDASSLVDEQERVFYLPEDKISLSLEYGLGENQLPASKACDAKQAASSAVAQSSERRFLRCVAGMPVAFLKEFIVKKYSVPGDYVVDIMYLEDVLVDDIALMDVAYIYSWCSVSLLSSFFLFAKRFFLLS